MTTPWLKAEEARVAAAKAETRGALAAADLLEQIAAEQAEIEECSRLARKMMSTRNPRGRALKGRVSSAQRRIARLEERLAALLETEPLAPYRAEIEAARVYCPACGLRGQHAFTCPRAALDLRAAEIMRETGATPEETLERATFEDAHGLIRPSGDPA